LGSQILQGRIHDRARLAWHKTLHKEYAEWTRESQKGWRNGLVLVVVVAVICLVLAFTRGANAPVIIELVVVVAVLVALLGLNALAEREVLQSSTTPIQGTLASSVGRFLRNNR